MKFAVPYDYATRCTGGSASGALALMRYVLDSQSGARNLGIYNCRSVRGGSTRSIHSEGRALDIGMPMSGGRGSAAGERLVRLLGANGDKLGIQSIIYNRKIYSAKSPSGRYYGGVNPHYDHLHVELTREAAARLTLATVRSVMANTRPTPSPSPGSGGGGGGGGSLPVHKYGSRTLREGMSGTDVGYVQRWVGVPDDGKFGPKTTAGVKRYQSRKGLTADGVVGDATWRAMNIRPTD